MTDQRDANLFEKIVNMPGGPSTSRRVCYDAASGRFKAEHTKDGKTTSLVFDVAQMKVLANSVEGTKLWLTAALTMPGRWVYLKDNAADGVPPVMGKYLKEGSKGE